MGKEVDCEKVIIYGCRSSPSWTEPLKTKLKRACPCCGFAVQVLKHVQGVFYNDRKNLYYSIRCPKCGMKTRRFYTAEAAASFWRDMP